MRNTARPPGHINLAATGDGGQRPADLIDDLSNCETSNEVRIQNHFGAVVSAYRASIKQALDRPIRFLRIRYNRIGLDPPVKINRKRKVISQ
jgi:hypothetical protein